jgi:ABC-2 type transport system ATP-binding protein
MKHIISSLTAAFLTLILTACGGASGGGSDSSIDSNSVTNSNDNSGNKDSDGDGVADNSDQCANTPEGEVTNSSGCAISQINFASCELTANLSGGKSIEVTLPTYDGEKVSFHILEPDRFDCDNIAQGAHPLMMHGPGYSGSGSTSGFTDYRSIGYTVISWDPRGFGNSSGTVRAMDPEFEGQYLNQILDWAERNLDFLAWRDESTGLFAARPLDATSQANGVNLIVGAQGSSYGGGFQLALLATDAKKRLDAIAPDITWHDLRDALNPGDIIKTTWGLALAGLGQTTGSISGGGPIDDGQDPFLNETLVRAFATNEWPRRSLDWMHYRGIGYWCAANGLPTMPYPDYQQEDDQIPMQDLADSYNVPSRQVDGRPGFGEFLVQPVDAGTYFKGLNVLLTHGITDTVFGFNHAWWNHQCLSTAGAQVSIQTHNGGHVLPVAQSPDKLSLSTGSCDFNMLNWFEHHLRDQQNQADETGVCFALGTEGDTVTLPASQVLAPQSPPQLANGFTRRAVNPILPIPNGPTGTPNISGNSPVFAPLGVANEEMVLAGIPHINIEVSNLSGGSICENRRNPDRSRSGCDSVTFVGLGKKSSGMSSYALIDDQLTPLRGLGNHNVDIVGVAERIKAGDELALLFYAEHPQFASSVSRDVSIPAVTVIGEIDLPLYVINADGQPVPGTSTIGAFGDQAH